MGRRVLLGLLALLSVVTPGFAADLIEVRVTPVSETMTVGESRTFSATAIYSDNTSADVTALATWGSLDGTVAAVNANGIVSAAAHGDTTISATYAGVTGNASIRVRGVDAHLFASSWGSAPNQVIALRADLITGALTPAGGAPAGLAPWGVATDPAGRFVYAVNREASTVSAYAVDPLTAALTPIGTYPTGGTWSRIAVVEPRGRFLYIANMGNTGPASISGYSIAADGTLSPVPGSPFAALGAVTIVAHPSGEFVYVTTGEDHRIAGYRIGADGALTEVPGSPCWFDLFGAVNNLADLAVHRTGRYLFSSDNGTSIRVFGIDSATGALTAQLSRHFQDQLGRGLVGHPDGRHLFASGQTGIYAFVFDESTATLSGVAGSPFPSNHTPQALALDPSGQYLYGVMGDQGGPSIEAFRTISIHRVNPVTGHAPRISTLDAAAGLLPGLAIVASDAAGPALTSIAVEPSNSTVQTTIFEIERPFTAIGTYSDGRSGPILGATWSSTDPLVASIDPDTGIATLHAYGQTTITVQRSGVTASTALTVEPAPLVALHVTPLSAIAAPGATYQFTATGVYSDGVNRNVTALAFWTSSAHAIATVAGGLATAASPGLATIGATVDGISASAQLSVRSTRVVSFVSDLMGRQVFGFTRAAGSPGLTSIGGSPFGGYGEASPQGVLLDPSGRLLFAADTNAGQISVFQVDGVSGQLTVAPGSPFTTRNSPTRLASDPTGRFLYALHQGQPRVSAFAVDRATGHLAPTTVDAILPFQGQSLAVESRGRFLYVGSGNGDGNDVIRAYAIDQATGALTTVGDYPSGRLPLSVASDPAGNYLYVAAAGDPAVVTFAIQPLTGALARITSVNPGAFPYRLAFHPSGNVLYVAAQTTSRLTPYMVNPLTGTLTPGTTIPLVGNVDSIAIEPGGEHLYVAADGVSLFASDSAGNLSLVQTYDAGADAYSVTVAPLGSDPAAVLTDLDVIPSSTIVYTSVPGPTRQLRAVGTYSDGTQAFLTSSVNWISSSDAAVSVSASGVATVHAVPASVTITASLGGASGISPFTTSSVADRLIVLPATETITTGSLRNYRATAIYPDQTSEDVTHAAAWTSLPSTVASIDATGVLLGVAPGDAAVQATFGGASGAATVFVRSADSRVYTSSWSLANEVKVFGGDAAGALTELGTSPAGLGPFGVATDPTGRWVYTVNISSGDISAFAAAAGPPVLAPIGTYSTGGTWPRVVIVEPRGRFVYVANAGFGSALPSIAAFAIAADGTLTPVPGSPFAVPGAVTLAVHPSGDFLYVTTGNDHRIGAYRIQSDGVLTAVAGSPYWFDDFGPVNNLADLAVHRSGRFLFSSDNGTSVRVFALDQASGALTGQLSRHFQNQLGRGLIAHPNGVHVFASGWTGIHAFAFDESTGTLTTVPGSPFSSSLAPNALAFDASAELLYAVNGEQGGISLEAMRSISVHRVNPLSGEVVRIGTLATSGSLMGIAVTAEPLADTTAPPVPLIDSHPANPSAPSTTSFVFAFSNAEAQVTFECSLDGVAFTACTSPASYAGLAAGSHTFSVRARDVAGNVSDAASFTWIHLAPLAPVFSNLTPSQSIVYGTPAITVSGTISAPGPAYPNVGEAVKIQTDGGIFFAPIEPNGSFTLTFSPQWQSLQAARGPYIVRYEYFGNGDLLGAIDISTMLTILRAPLTIIADNKTMPVGGPLPALTATYVGFAAGDNPFSLLGRPVLSTTATTVSPAGTYPIIVGGAESESYEISYVQGTITVTGGGDTTPPIIVPTVIGTLGDNGWYRSDATVSWSVTDPESPVTASGCGTQVITSDTNASGMAITCSASSAGGAASRTVTITRDTTAPSVTYSGNAGTYPFASFVSIGCVASDPVPGSGIASTTCQNIAQPAYVFGAGTHIVSASATDRAGWTGNAMATFIVLPSPNLCSLTREFVRASTTYQAMTLNQQNAVENHVNAICGHVRKELVQPYQSGITALSNQRLLTADELALLNELAELLW